MRLFFALWPPAKTAHALAQWTHQIAHDTGGTPTASDQIHLTLAFLGEADPAKAFNAAQRVQGARHVLPIEQAQYWKHNGDGRPTCVGEGTWGADWYEGLGPDGRATELIIDKHRYSAFIGTRLDQVLRSNGIRSIVVAGVATSGCVESTIRDGFMLDYYVVIPSDACGDYDADRHRATLTKMDLSFGTVVTVDDLVGAWATRLARL